ncbi:MBL fold metallo-hydrolase [Selenomonas sp.]|uniref:MBL fold metallo-hydrolase n=1 Tax=Selenomonas sp. TaxID=2053611 RepID=UPI0025CB87DE|nr:MBL fold metallo-hydrolase [Selenomonas sp.]
MTILLTHEHPDHTAGVPALRREFSVNLICQRECARRIMEKRNNRLLALLPLARQGKRKEISFYYHACPSETILADETFDREKRFQWHEHSVFMQAWPGHSPGSCGIKVDENCIFTGDAMIPDSKVILRYPGASVEAYKHRTLPKLLSISEQTRIFPGHGMPCQYRELQYREGMFQYRAGGGHR